jgi:hypothetical protein
MRGLYNEAQDLELWTELETFGLIVTKQTW